MFDETMDLAEVYSLCQAIKGQGKGHSSLSFDPATKALRLVFSTPRKTVRYIRSSKNLTDASVRLARADYGGTGLLLQLEIHPLEAP